jgi:ATP-dependent DNA helicase PIF1
MKLLFQGTRPFWACKKTGLLAQARFLSRSTAPLFITLSCADMQWDDLHRHMPRYEEYLTGNNETRRKIVWENVQNNPHIVAHYLEIRFRIFLKTVLKQHFNVEDHWYRFERQMRGSSHIHGML